MSARVQTSDALRALRPLEVASYLRVHGWRQEADLDARPRYSVANRVHSNSGIDISR